MYRFTAFCAALLLAGCAVHPPVATLSPANPTPTAEPAALPYPEPDLQDQIDQLSATVDALEQQVRQLHTRIIQLEQRPTGRTTASARTPRLAAHRPAAPATDTILQQAQTAYRQNQYPTVLQLLADADGGGSGQNTDRQKMQLLLNSHLHLGNCQSVIDIGQRYAILFAGQSGAAEALYSVGQCQWQIQQRDVARDTWRKLMRTYPQSQAAKRAAARINQR